MAVFHQDSSVHVNFLTFLPNSVPLYPAYIHGKIYQGGAENFPMGKVLHVFHWGAWGAFEKASLHTLYPSL